MNSPKRTERRREKMSNPGKSKKSSLCNVRVSRLENLKICTEHRSPKKRGLNTIPTGNQLPRTPVKRTSLTGKKDADEITSNPKMVSLLQMNDENVPCSDCAPFEVEGNTSKDHFGKSAVHEQQQLDEELQGTCGRRFSIISVAARNLEEIDADHFIQGMHGYQWTQADLDFVQCTQNERPIQQLKSVLRDLLKQLKEEHQRKNLALAAKEKILADHPEIAALDLTMQLARDFLHLKLGTANMEALDLKSHLTLIQVADIQQATREEKAEVATLEKRLARAQKLRKQQEKQKKTILQKQAKVDRLNDELSELKLKLCQAEDALRAKQRQVEAVKVPELTEGDVDMAKVVRRSQRIARRKENFLEREVLFKKIHSLK